MNPISPELPISPEPWRLEVDEFGKYANVVASNDHIVASFDFDEDAAVDIDAEIANASMVAAAPKLYGALIMVRDADEDCKKDGLPTIPPIARKRIDDAIAMAEGK